MIIYFYLFEFHIPLITDETSNFGHDMSMVEIGCCNTHHRHNVRTSKQGVEYARLLSILALIVVHSRVNSVSIGYAVLNMCSLSL